MGLICTCQGCGVKLDAVRSCVLLSAGVFAFLHGALLAGRVLGSSSETDAAVRNNLRSVTGDNYTDPNTLPEDDDVSHRARPPAAEKRSRRAQTPPQQRGLLLRFHVSLQPADTAMRIIVNGLALIGNVCGTTHYSVKAPLRCLSAS